MPAPRIASWCSIAASIICCCARAELGCVSRCVVCRRTQPRLLTLASTRYHRPLASLDPTDGSSNELNVACCLLLGARAEDSRAAQQEGRSRRRDQPLIQRRRAQRQHSRSFSLLPVPSLWLGPSVSFTPLTLLVSSLVKVWRALRRRVPRRFPL